MSIEGRAIFSQQIVNGLMLGSIYAMIGVALTLSIGVLKFLNFSIPGLFMIGGMTTWMLIRHGVPWPIAAEPSSSCCTCLFRSRRSLEFGLR